MQLGVQLGAFARLGRVVDQVRADDRRLHALHHHLPQRLSHDDLQVHGLLVVLRLPGRHLDGVLLEVHRRFRLHDDIFPPLKTQQPLPDGAFQPDWRSHIPQNPVQALDCVALALLLRFLLHERQLGGVTLAQALGHGERKYLHQQPSVFGVPAPQWCLPTCSSALTSERASWLQLLTKPGHGE